MRAGQPTVADGPTPRSDDAFQQLLLELAAAAAEGTSSPALIRFFCRSTREFFRTAGAYFWRRVSSDELLGAEADGLMAGQFRGSRLHGNESAVAMEAVRSRRTTFVNHLDPMRYPMAAQYRARSILAAPLIVAGEVMGAVVYLHDADPEFFDDDLAAKATILAGQLCSLLEAQRLSLESREEHRRAEILAEVAQALHGMTDCASVIEGLADRIRGLLRTPLVCILLREGGSFELQAVAAESPELANAVRSRNDRKALRLSMDLAARAASAEETISVAISPEGHALGNLVPAGTLMAVPIRTSRRDGALLVYPRCDGPFSREEKSLAGAIAGFGGVAIANAELFGIARSQAGELHQLLEITSELGTIGNLDEFLQRFSIRAAEFLGFGRVFLGLLEGDGAFHVRWGAQNGKPLPVDTIFPQGVASRALLQKEVFWTNDPRAVPGANLEMISQFAVRQLLIVPLLGTEGQVLGMFGGLDRVDQAQISKEHVRLARTLAAHASVALQVKRNLHASEQHRRRAESLMALALQLGSVAQLAEFARNFVCRAAEMMGTEAGALALNQDSVLEVLYAQRSSTHPIKDAALLGHLSSAFQEYLRHHSEAVFAAPAAELLGDGLAQSLGWQTCTMVRLVGISGELMGVLCLANRGRSLMQEERPLLLAIAGHASVALENARLFTRMDHANRHWIEIFDAITDFIVVHDEAGRVLRVNRSLADFVGVQPQHLIGVCMSALLAQNDELPQPGCPFCVANAPDEYVHSGLQRTYLVSSSNVHSANSEGLQTIHVLKDITDRREAERRYRDLFDNIQEGAFFSTEGGRFIEVNDALVRMLGYTSHEELLQVDIPTQLYDSPEQRTRSLQEMEQSGWALRNFEETLRRKDGSPIHVIINAFAVRDSAGRVRQYRGLMADISGLKGYQAELQRERDFSGKILNNTQNLIAVADLSGLVTYVNRRWNVVGYEQAQLLGQPLAELVIPARRQNFLDAFSGTLSGGQVDNLELQIVRGDGRIGQFSANMSPMRDEHGAVVSVVAVMSDITDAASLQAKLQHAEKLAAVGQLVSGVAHEVNNPLTAILGFADLLLESPDLPENARKDLRVILQEAQRTKQIVQNLLSFARQVPRQRRPVELNLVLRRTLQLRTYDFHSHGIEVLEKFDEALPPIIGDAHQLQQVFLNILNNAYDAVKEVPHPRIEITTARIAEHIEITFRDNGCGISSPDRIFDPFFTTKDIGKGTGLGLSICYGIVREHGGEITGQNSPGTPGAIFQVRLPLEQRVPMKPEE